MTTLSAQIDWMRHASLLAAACLVRLPEDAPLDPEAPYAQDRDAWEALAQKAPRAPIESWVLAASAASERYPDAAAAFSILAEDERLCLPTAASFARIAAAGLGVAYDIALHAALAESTGTARLERVEQAGHARPATHQGIRILPAQVALTLGAEPSRTRHEIEACPPVILHPREARAAAQHLQNTGAVWIRGTSRRLARQFALDLAGILKQDALFLRYRDDALPDIPDIAALPVLDLFDAARVPDILPPQGFAVIAPARLDHPGFAGMDAPAPGPDDLAALWATVPIPERDRSALARRFHLTLPELRAAQAEAETLMSVRHPANGVPTPPPDAQTLAQAILADGARRMGPSVTLVTSDVTFDDLVASAPMRAQLDDAVNWHRHGAQVWRQMGLARDSADARGLSLLFSGPPGGGKTFAARCLANELRLNLYRIDLSQVVSKYIGETEKALARIFDEAEAGHGILFFDEADAIFGKRSEVKDAHDRYANIEVGFLLQRMESFDGVMILATNLRANLDPAFLRRIRFAIDFPMPGRAERRLLWDRNLPNGQWRDTGVDIDDLAERFRLSGGNIRNAAVAAAHLAAADHGPVRPAHMARALVRELEKSGLPRGIKDLGPLAAHLEGGA